VLWLVNKLGENKFGTNQNLSFIWDTLSKTIAFGEEKTNRVEAWTKKLFTIKKTTQENLDCFVGTLINTTPTV